MKRSFRLAVCLSAGLCTRGAFAQAVADFPEATESNTTATAPVAHIYVASVINPTSSSQVNEVYAFSAAANGKLTNIAGSPFNLNMSSMSVDGNFLFGLIGNDIDTFTIGSNGALHLAQSINAATHESGGCGGIGPLRLDHSGKVLYNAFGDSTCDGEQFEYYGVNGSTGKLTYLGDTGPNFLNNGYLNFLSNNKFVYSQICTEYDHEEVGYLQAFQRQANGSLTSFNLINTGPPTKEGFTSWCPLDLATDPSGHMAALLSDQDADGTTYGNPVIAAYTAESTGQLSTTNTYKNMPSTASGAFTLRMSPSGKLLAVAGSTGLQIFHFNGASPVTPYKTLLTSGYFDGVYWDNSNHLYAIEWNSYGKGKLYAYTITPTSVTEAPGSPYAIPNPEYLIVQPK